MPRREITKYKDEIRGEMVKMQNKIILTQKTFSHTMKPVFPDKLLDGRRVLLKLE